MKKFELPLAIVIWLMVAVLSYLIIPAAMAADFNKAIPIVLKHEGHLSYDPKDPGGITNYGMSFRYLKDLIKKRPDIMKMLDANDNCILDDYDIAHMKLEDAIKIYRKEWWENYKFNTIAYQPLANKMFDLSVNVGEAQALKFLARAYVKLYPKEKSGELYGFVNKLPESTQQNLVRLLCLEAENFYKGLAKTHPAYQKFLKGWLNRAWDGVKK